MNYSELLQLAKGWGNFVSDRINIWRLQKKSRPLIRLLRKIEVIVKPGSVAGTVPAVYIHNSLQSLVLRHVSPDQENPNGRRYKDHRR